MNLTRLPRSGVHVIKAGGPTQLSFHLRFFTSLGFYKSWLLQVLAFTVFGFSIEYAMTLVGEYRDIIPHLQQVHFGQGPQIIEADRRKFGSLGFDVAEHPAEADCRVWI
jgi:hypothetical protein